MKHLATCLCENLKLEYSGELKPSALCHCYGCQKRTGSIFGTQTLVEKNLTTISGESKFYDFEADTKGVIRMYSCPTCSTTLNWDNPYFPDHYTVAVGCFANAEFPAPTFSVHEDRMHKWLTLPDTIETHMD